MSAPGHTDRSNKKVALIIRAALSEDMGRIRAARISMRRYCGILHAGGKHTYRGRRNCVTLLDPNPLSSAAKWGTPGKIGLPSGFTDIDEAAANFRRVGKPKNERPCESMMNARATT